MRPIRVFLTGAGGAGTIEVIRSLKATGRYYVITGDASASAGGYAFADRSYVMPWVVDPRYEAVVREILLEERPDFVIPLIDEEIGLVHRIVSADFPSVRVVAPRPEFCESMLDKFSMAEKMSAVGLSVARTWLACDATSVEFPAIVKPRTGRGSRGFAVIETRQALDSYLAGTDQPPERFIVQEKLEGREFTTSAVVALGGPLLAVVPKEATIKKGITQVGVTRRVPAIERLVRDIQDQLHADGPFNVQLMLGADGVPKVFEVNPRYSTTVALTVGAGLDEVDVVLRHALGEPAGSLEWRPDVMMVRYTAQAFLNEADFSPIDRS
jgi:carbamoyl-phosphate synthase large subunit